ncbi:hypothetical protein AB664_13080 [Brucella anthropi]|uniref:Uncharacterized protein n=1 Tax=Brucella anthropi TaxID=529 RepID=A0A656Z392_BRUAN|nr:hypothetical protein AB664_13080 [Brucella anthropi]
MGVVADMADRVAVMYAGRIIEQAPVEAIFARQEHPYTKLLLSPFRVSMVNLKRICERLKVSYPISVHGLKAVALHRVAPLQKINVMRSLQSFQHELMLVLLPAGVRNKWERCYERDTAFGRQS